MKKIISQPLGSVFGNLTVISEPYRKIGGTGKHTATYVTCRCACGKEYPVKTWCLRNGYIVSCGCKGSINKGVRKHPNGCCWHSLISRCEHPTDAAYANYGARGIRVCERWMQSFWNFVEDMGIRPSKAHSIERIDVNKGYYKENCTWATRLEQAYNKRNTVYYEYKGEKVRIIDLMPKSVVSSKVLGARIRTGWDIDEALYTPQLYSYINGKKVWRKTT